MKKLFLPKYNIGFLISVLFFCFFVKIAYAESSDININNKIKETIEGITFLAIDELQNADLSKRLSYGYIPAPKGSIKLDADLAELTRAMGKLDGNCEIENDANIVICSRFVQRQNVEMFVHLVFFVEDNGFVLEEARAFYSPQK